MRWLLYLYPPVWRDRYGAEVARLAAELVRAGDTTPLRAALDLIRGAAVERVRAAGRPSPVSLTVRNALFGSIESSRRTPAGRRSVSTYRQSQRRGSAPGTHAR